MATTAPACKAAILTILAADTNLVGVDRRWAPPTENEDATVQGEAVWFGDTEIVDDNWASLGSAQGKGRRRETYRLTLTVWVAQFGDDPQTTETRAWAIWNLIDGDLRTDLFTRPGSLLIAAGVQTFGQITATQSTGVFSPSQWGARVDARVTFQATTV